MRASHRDANEGFEANSQQAPPFVNFYPLPAFPSLVFINTGNGMYACEGGQQVGESPTLILNRFD